MGEVDHVEQAEEQAEADRDQSVYAAQNHPIEEVLDEKAIHSGLSRFVGSRFLRRRMQEPSRGVN